MQSDNLSAYSVPNTVLGARDTIVNKITESLILVRQCTSPQNDAKIIIICGKHYKGIPWRSAIEENSWTSMVMVNEVLSGS